MRKIEQALLFIILLVVIGPINIVSFPNLASEFYGNVTINWTSAYVGANVTAYDTDGVLCGYFIVSNEGRYGLLSCNGDDTENS